MVSHILILDQSRSATHLLRRVLGEQPSVELLDNAFSAVRGTQVEWLTSEDWATGMPKASLQTFNREIAKGIQTWRDTLSAFPDKIILTHDHPFTTTAPSTILDFIHNPTHLPSPDNITQLPDDLLLKSGTIPVLTIRDPRLAVTSAFRVLASFGLPHGSGRPNFLITTATVWQRKLYEFFISKGIEPLVVDGDDVMTSQDFCRKLIARLGLDPNLAVFEWTPPSKEEKEAMHPMLYASQKYLTDSSSVKSNRAAKNMDLDAEEKKWEAEFGEDAALVREAVELATPHYNWLYERRYKGS